MWFRKKQETAKRGPDRRETEIDKLKDEAADLKRINESLETEKKNLNEEVEHLKLKAKIDEEDIKHHVKLLQESQEAEHSRRMGELEIEFEKKAATAELDKNKAIGVIKEDYRDKMEVQLKSETEGVRKTQEQILERLPKVNVNMGSPTIKD